MIYFCGDEGGERSHLTFVPPLLYISQQLLTKGQRPGEHTEYIFFNSIV